MSDLTTVRPPMHISDTAWELLQNIEHQKNAKLTPEQIWEKYKPPVTLGATEGHQLAMDNHLRGCGFQTTLMHAINLGMGFGEIAPQFLGYPYLAGLSQNGLIRAGVTTIADEMTKRWIEFKVDGEDDSALADDLKTLQKASLDFGLKDIFNEAAQKCDFDGGCLVYINTGETRDEVLERPLYMDPNIIGQGSIKGFVLVEAVNLYPGLYNAVDPLRKDYFRPDHWMVLGRKIHRSRFLYFAPNKLSVLLRPAYNFFGIPTAQLALDYVAHFTKTREAAQRLLTKFSQMVFKSDVLAQILSGGSSLDDVNRRMQLFAQYRDNDSIVLIDREKEDIVKLDTPLNGVIDVPRQALEFVAAMFRMPVVKLLGISPAGMNATGEYDESNFYEHVSSKQEKILGRPVETINKLLQLHLFGAIRPTIKAEFCALTEEDETQKATTQNLKTGNVVSLVTAGVISEEEARQFLHDDPDSGFAFIDVSDVPEPPENPFLDEGASNEYENSFENEEGRLAAVRA